MSRLGAGPKSTLGSLRISVIAARLAGVLPLSAMRPGRSIGRSTHFAGGQVQAPYGSEVGACGPGSTRGRPAGDVAQALTASGYQAGTVANASVQSQTVQSGTQVFYGAGASANAALIAAKFGATAAALISLPAGHVEVLLGSTATAVPSSLTTTQTSGAGTAAPSPTSTSAGNDGETGGALTVAANAKYGVPCVY
jgi:hypothetical protein